MRKNNADVLLGEFVGVLIIVLMVIFATKSVNDFCWQEECVCRGYASVENGEFIWKSNGDAM